MLDRASKMAEFFEHGNELSGSIKSRRFSNRCAVKDFAPAVRQSQSQRNAAQCKSRSTNRAFGPGQRATKDNHLAGRWTCRRTVTDRQTDRQLALKHANPGCSHFVVREYRFVEGLFLWLSYQQLAGYERVKGETVSYKAIILSDDYRLSLPVGSFIVLK